MGSTLYRIIDVPENVPCEKCFPYLSLRLLELGFIKGKKIEVEDSRLGIYMVRLLDENGTIETTYGLRDYELDRVKRVKI